MKVRVTLITGGLLVGPLIVGCSAKTAVANSPAAFCASLTSSSASVANPSATMTADQLRTRVQQSVSDVQAADNLAPAEIKADMDILAKATTTSADSLAKVGYDRTKIDARAVSPFAAADVVAARQHITAYVKTKCTFSTGSPSSS